MRLAVGLVLAALLAVVAADGVAWTRTLNGYEYKLFGTKRTWHDAEKACVAEGGHLFSLPHREDGLLIRLLFGQGFWTGLNDIQQEGEYEWSDGTSVDYIPWGKAPRVTPEQPDNFFNQDCVVYRAIDGVDYQYFTDEACTDQLPYLCQRAAAVSITPVIAQLTKGRATTLKVVLKEKPSCPDLLDSECEVQVEVRGTRRIVTEPCVVVFTGENWNQPATISVSAPDDFINENLVHDQLVTPTVVTNADNYVGFNPPEIQVNLAPARHPATCASTGDPHYTTFDGHRLHWYKTGTVLFHRSLSRDFEVQTRVWGCGRANPVRVSCNCAVAAQENGNFFSLDVCSRTPVYKFYSAVPEDRQDDYKARVVRSGSNKFKVTFPSGSVLQVQYHNWGMNVWLTVPGDDLGKSVGMCGNFDTQSGNDCADWPGGRCINKLDFQQGDTFYISETNANKNLFLFDGYATNYNWKEPTIRAADFEPRDGNINCPNPPKPKRRLKPGEVTITDILETDTREITGLLQPYDFDPVATGEAAVYPVVIDGKTYNNQEEVEAVCESFFTSVAVHDLCATELWDALVDVMPQTFEELKQGILTDCAEDYVQFKADVSPVIASLHEALQNACSEAADLLPTSLADLKKRIANLICPLDCAGNGRCELGVCVCDTGFMPPNCEHEQNKKPTLRAQSPVVPQEVDVAVQDQPSHILLVGQDFVPGAARIHYEDAAFGNLPCVFISSSQLRCPLPPTYVHTQVDARVLSFRVSNGNGADGQPLLSEQTAHFTFYNSGCNTKAVDGTISTLDPLLFCNINNRCFGDKTTDTGCGICDITNPPTSRLSRNKDKVACVPHIIPGDVEVTVPEDFADDVLFTLQATNAVVSGVAYPKKFSLDTDLFSVHEDLGTITPNFEKLGGHFDFDETKVYEFTATVSDGELSAHATVKVNIANTNFPPSSLTLSSTSFDEPQSPGEIPLVVGSLSATDPDDEQTTFTYALVSDPSGLFSVVSGQLQLTTFVDFDNQPSSTFPVAISVSDGLLTLTKDFIITVNGIDEAVSLSLSGTTVTENADLDTVVGTLTGTDPEHQDVAISLVTQNTPFSITQASCNNGVCTSNLVVSGAIDFETKASYRLLFEAVETGNSNTVTVAYDITVNDASEPPTGIQNLSPLEVEENAAVGTLVSVLRVVDPDASDRNGYEDLSIVSSQSMFEVDKETQGFVVRVAGAIDFEATPTVSLTVRATHSSSATFDFVITVTVMDVNEPPVFAPNDLRMFTSITEGTEGTYALIQQATFVTKGLSATDPENDNLLYEVAFGVDDSLNDAVIVGHAFDGFDIAGDGRLKVNFEPDYETRSKYILQVRAFDGRLYSEPAIISVTVTAVEEAPTFSAEAYAGSVHENAPAGTVLVDDSGSVLQVKATDPEGFAVRFYFRDNKNKPVSSLGPFSIDISSGLVTVTNDNSIDYETYTLFGGQPVVTLTVMAVDSNAPFLTAPTAQLTVTILDVNEPPIINPNGYVHRYVAFNEPRNSEVLAPTVVDPEGQRVEVSLQVVSGPSDLSTRVFLAKQSNSKVIVWDEPIDVLDFAELVSFPGDTEVGPFELKYVAEDRDGLKTEITLKVTFYDGCSPWPCKNGYACYDWGKTRGCDDRKCGKAGFTGDLCTINIDECATAGCVSANTVECVDLIEDFECKCKTGFTGRQCEVNLAQQQASQCSKNPCKNDGTCFIDGDGEQQCKCLAGFTGDKCQKVAKESVLAATATVQFDGVTEFDGNQVSQGTAVILGIPLSSVTTFETNYIIRRDVTSDRVYAIIQARWEDFSTLSQEEVLSRLSLMVSQGTLLALLRNMDESYRFVTVKELEVPRVLTVPNPQYSAEASASSSSGTSVAIPIAVAAVLLVALLVGALFYRRHRNHLRYYKDKQAELEDIILNGPKRSKRPINKPVLHRAIPEDLTVSYARWLFPEMTRRETDSLFAGPKQRRDGVFLVREKPTMFALSLVTDNVITHHLIELKHGKFVIDDVLPEQDCTTLAELLSHLQSTADVLPEQLAPTGQQYEEGMSAWLHKDLSRSDAVRILKDGDMKNGRFLIRQKDVTLYALSVFVAAKNVVEHHLLERGRSGYYKFNRVRLDPPCKTLVDVIDRLTQDTVPGLSTKLSRAINDAARASEEPPVSERVEINPAYGKAPANAVDLPGHYQEPEMITPATTAGHYDDISPAADAKAKDPAYEELPPLPQVRVLGLEAVSTYGSDAKAPGLTVRSEETITPQSRSLKDRIAALNKSLQAPKPSMWEVQGEQDWLQPEVSKEEAVAFAKRADEGTFVIHGADKARFLTVRTESGVRTDRIQADPSGRVRLILPDIGVQQPKFDSLGELVAFYQLPRRGVPFELSDNNPQFEYVATTLQHRRRSLVSAGLPEFSENAIVTNGISLSHAEELHVSSDDEGDEDDDVDPASLGDGYLYVRASQRRGSRRTKDEVKDFKPLTLN